MWNRGLESFVTDPMTVDHISSSGDLPSEELLIECFTNVFGGKVKIDESFFPTKKLDIDSVENETLFDPTPPSRYRIIGATIEYERSLASQAVKIEKLVPEFLMTDMYKPSNIYWEYPKAVTDFGLFERKMTSILPQNEIKKLICRVGFGDTLKLGDNALINYYVYSEGCKDCVESNKRKGKPHLVQLGKRSPLPVIELGTLSMAVKEVSAFLANPEFSFGKYRAGAWIPENKRVLCIIEVLQRLPQFKPDSVSIYHMSSSEQNTLAFEQIYDFALNKKSEGDNNYNMKDYVQALRCYMQGICTLKNAISDNKEKIDLLHILHGRGFQTSRRLALDTFALQFLIENTELPVSTRKNAPIYYYCAKLYFQGRIWNKAKICIELALIHLDTNPFVQELNRRINVAIVENNKENLEK